MFDSGSRTLLRQFKGHKAPVHVARFAGDQLHVLSAGDDGLVALWDVASGQQVGVLWRGRCVGRGAADVCAWTMMRKTSAPALLHHRITRPRTSCLASGSLSQVCTGLT